MPSATHVALSIRQALRIRSPRGPSLSPQGGRVVYVLLEGEAIRHTAGSPRKGWNSPVIHNQARSRCPRGRKAGRKMAKL